MSKNETHKEKMMRKKLERAKIITNAPLWSVKPPKHDLDDIGGKVTLYHFTRDYRLNDIMQYGVIFGDVITSPTTGFNALNLTLESHYHDPSYAKKQIVNNDYYRLTVILDADDPKLINYGWFDKTYCDNINRKTVEGKVEKTGMKEDLDKQYIYKGEISSKMIKRVNVWNKDTSFWDRLTKDEIENVCSKYRNLPFTLYGSTGLPCFAQLRVTGMNIGQNDYTGMVETYNKEKDPIDPWKPLYQLTDELCQKLKGKNLHAYQNNVLYLVYNDDVWGAISFIVKMYNRFSGKFVLFIILKSELDKLHHNYQKWLSHHNELIKKVA